MPLEQDQILQHLQICDECLKLYHLAVSDKALIERFFSELESGNDEISIPGFQPLSKKRNRNKFWIFAPIIVAASIIGFIILFQLGRDRNVNKIPEAEIIMYEFQEGKDLNKIWHEKTQILLIQDKQGNVIQPIITN
jgi:hypothetical protein